LAGNFFEAIGWDAATCMPDEDSLEDLDLPPEIANHSD